MKAATAWPTELSFNRSERALDVAFDDGARFRIPFELLRIESPSAEERGHGANAVRTLGGKADIGVVSAEPVGRYAVRITFDDGHDSGLFSWRLLRELGEETDDRMNAYLVRLASAGLTRR